MGASKRRAEGSQRQARQRAASGKASKILAPRMGRGEGFMGANLSRPCRGGAFSTNNQRLRASLTLVACHWLPSYGPFGASVDAPTMVPIDAFLCYSEVANSSDR